MSRDEAQRMVPSRYKRRARSIHVKRSLYLASSDKPVGVSHQSYTFKDIIRLQSNILEGGFQGPFCWYKQLMFKITPKEDNSKTCLSPNLSVSSANDSIRDTDFTPSQYVINKPVFFGAADHDYVCLPVIGEQLTRQFCPNGKVYHYDTDHWIIFAASDQLNTNLLEWIGSSVQT